MNVKKPYCQFIITGEMLEKIDDLSKRFAIEDRFISYTDIDLEALGRQDREILFPYIEVANLYLLDDEDVAVFMNYRFDTLEKTGALASEVEQVEFFISLYLKGMGRKRKHQAIFDFFSH